ncbi:hypothetical protein BLNAU_1647 [Blattamonas nauphoetae]|uniref:Uncharacterized protein n=1 Tax=Blattamonas nauphoetae TaxID=2049346 RepID=A0ABQ9YH78_9EUKA|nr:hypothetical protein BLNAU_1647 [Blattamonas nauphoetae]
MLKKSGPHPRVAKLNHNKHALLFQLSTSEKRIHWFVSEFTSLDGASRTRTFQAADSITFIQVFNSQFSDQTFGTFHVLRVFDSLFENNKAGTKGGCISTHYSDHTRSVRALQLHSHKPHRSPPPPTPQSNPHFPPLKSCAVGCEVNLRSGPVQQRENRKVARLLSSDATSASTHPSTGTTATADPCPESLVRSFSVDFVLNGNASPFLFSDPSPLRPVSTHGDRRKCRIFGPIWRGSCSGANVGTRIARGCGMNGDSVRRNDCIRSSSITSDR